MPKSMQEIIAERKAKLEQERLQAEEAEAKKAEKAAQKAAQKLTNEDKPKRENDKAKFDAIYAELNVLKEQIKQITLKPSPVVQAKKPSDVFNDLLKLYKLPTSITQAELRLITLENKDHQAFLRRYRYNSKELDTYYNLSINTIV